MFFSFQALSKNGKVYGSDIMVGVMPCIEKVQYYCYYYYYFLPVNKKLKVDQFNFCTFILE